MANDFTDVGFFGFEEQESAPSQAQQEEDRDLMQRAMNREEALANVARTDPYASEALYQSGMLAPEFPSDPLAPEPLLPVREQQRIGPFGLGDKAGIRFTDEETERIYDYINFQREYDPSGRRKYPEVELNAEFQLAKLKGTKPPKKSVVTTFRGVPQDDKANVPIIKSTSPTTGGLSELDKLTRSTLDDDALYAETLIPTDIPRGSFYDNRRRYETIEGERRRKQLEDFLKSQAERDALLAQQESIESQADENYLNLIAQGQWSPASGPRYAPLSTIIGTDPTLGPTREDIFGVPRATDLITPSPLSTAIGTDPTSGPTREDIYGVPRSAPVEPLIEGTANPYLEAASAWPPLSYGQFPVDKTRQRAAQSRENIMSGSGPSFYSPGTWGVRDWRGKVGSTRELDELEGQMPVWTGYNPDFKGGLSNVGNLLGGLNFNDILKNLLISIGGGALGIPPVATAALNLVGSRLLPKYSFPTVSGEEEIIEPWEVIQAGGEEQRAQGGLISLAHGGNPSVYQAGENIEKLLATKMGYEGDKYSGVPNQEGMINTVNQNIGDNIKSGLRSIVANAYAQGNVPAPSVPQYNQAQLLNKGLTMLPNTANAPVPQQPQPQPVSNINTAYAQSTLPQSHYMQPNQVT
jgi:hypothetical protein